MDAELSPRGPISSPRNGIPGAATAEADLGQEEESAVGSGADRAQGPPPGRAGVKAWLARSRNRTILGWLAFAVAFAEYVAVQGFPYSEDTVLLWVTAALLVSSLGDLSRWRRGLVRDWLPLYVVLSTYALLRGYASHVLWGPFIRPQVAFDNFIGLGVAPTVRLQSLLFNPAHLRPWDYAAWAVYMTHFFVCYVVAGVLWKRDYARFKRFVPLFVGLTFVAYAGYVFYPAIPPWMASQNGYLPVTTRIIPLVWQRIGVLAQQLSSPTAASSPTTSPRCPRCMPRTRCFCCCSSGAGPAPGSVRCSSATSWPWPSRSCTPRSTS